MKTACVMRRTLAIGAIGAIALFETVPAAAAPVLTSTAVVKTTAPEMIDQVRVRRRVGTAAAIGLLGAVVGAAATTNQYYYGPGPGYYGPGYYGPGYYGGTGYYGPYGGYPYPYGYGYGSGYGYGYGYDRSGAAVAGAMIGAIIGTAVAQNPRLYRPGRQPYGYYAPDPQRVW